MHFIVREAVVGLQHQHLDDIPFRGGYCFNFVDSVVIRREQELGGYVRDSLIRRKGEQTVFVDFPRVIFAGSQSLSEH